MVTSIDTPLFDQAEGIEYPAKLLHDFATGSFGLRYTYIGDDGDYLAILGHPEQERIDTLCRRLDFIDGDSETAIWTWARMLTTCPDHQGVNDDCAVCQRATPEDWWLDWAPIANPDANANKPGYFPITVLGG